MSDNSTSDGKLVGECAWFRCTGANWIDDPYCPYHRKLIQEGRV